MTTLVILLKSVRFAETLANPRTCRHKERVRPSFRTCPIEVAGVKGLETLQIRGHQVEAEGRGDRLRFARVPSV